MSRALLVALLALGGGALGMPTTLGGCATDTECAEAEDRLCGQGERWACAVEGFADGERVA